MILDYNKELKKLEGNSKVLSELMWLLREVNTNLSLVGSKRTFMLSNPRNYTGRLLSFFSDRVDNIEFPIHFGKLDFKPLKQWNSEDYALYEQQVSGYLGETEDLKRHYKSMLEMGISGEEMPQNP
jgi:hypothetical protein